MFVGGLLLRPFSRIKAVEQAGRVGLSPSELIRHDGGVPYLEWENLQRPRGVPGEDGNRRVDASPPAFPTRPLSVL